MKSLLSALPLVALYAATVFGQEVKDVALDNVINDEKVSLSSYSSAKGIVLIFTSNECPYDEHYRKRFSELADAYRENVPVLLINAHNDPRDSRDKMLAKARSLNLRIPYLADKEQILSAQLGVKKSPEAFLLKNVNGKFAVVYRGAIDDNAQVEADVRRHYLRNAIDNMLAGKSIAVTHVRPIGCNLRRKM